eukprot:scaffold78340_cov59-Cyclotella_meneghiniana.AAC.1
MSTPMKRAPSVLSTLFHIIFDVVKSAVRVVTASSDADTVWIGLLWAIINDNAAFFVFGDNFTGIRVLDTITEMFNIDVEGRILVDRA